MPRSIYSKGKSIGKKGGKKKEKNAFFFIRKSETIASFVLHLHVIFLLFFFVVLKENKEKENFASTCHIDISGCLSPVLCHVSLSISEKKKYSCSFLMICTNPTYVLSFPYNYMSAPISDPNIFGFIKKDKHSSENALSTPSSSPIRGATLSSPACTVPKLARAPTPPSSLRRSWELLKTSKRARN